MANLPDEWHEIDAPVREDREVFVGSLGGASWDVFQVLDDTDAPVPLTGMAIDAELRGLDDSLVGVLTAEITDIPNGWCRVALAAAVAAALPTMKVGTDARFKLGRYAVFITDDTDRWCIKSGDVWGVRR